MSDKHFHIVCSKVDPELLPRIVAILPALLADENVAVTKKLTLCLSSVYKTALQVNYDVMASCEFNNFNY